MSAGKGDDAWQAVQGHSGTLAVAGHAKQCHQPIAAGWPEVGPRRCELTGVEARALQVLGQRGRLDQLQAAVPDLRLVADGASRARASASGAAGVHDVLHLGLETLHLA